MQTYSHRLLVTAETMNDAGAFLASEHAEAAA
jgi:hypothetical protein